MTVRGNWIDIYSSRRTSTLLEAVARDPHSSSPPRPLSFSTLHLHPLLPRATLSPIHPPTPSIIPHIHMLTFLQHTISIPASLTPSPIPSSCLPWVGHQQWLEAHRGPWELV